ncbi:twin-arginine translocation signal domain-containing protein [bacterium]|nr:twin-arginine translocation signal domain-containing protein [bacterium]
MYSIDRRDFLKKSGLSIAAAASSGLWANKLFADSIPVHNNLFSEQFGVTPEDMKKILNIALSKGGRFSELFFEYKINNVIVMEEGLIKNASENISMGVGIRVLKDDQTGFAYTNDLSMSGMKNAALTAAAISNSGQSGHVANLRKYSCPHQIYDLTRQLHSIELGDKLKIVRKTYDATKSFDSRIVMAQSFLLDEIQHIAIANSNGLMTQDTRPASTLYALAVAIDGSKRTSGFQSSGGRVGMNFFENIEPAENTGKSAAEEAIILLSAIDASAGDQPVVLGVGQSGVMVHEAVGHPFEADGIRKKTSIFWDRYGKQIAKPIVNIYEDATIPHYRGSLNIDDEGMKTQKTQLVENGKLVGFIQDKLNADIMGHTPTGNGRRDSYQSYPIPRMTNTVLAAGDSDPQDIIKSVKKGFYAKSFEGGNVQDSGKFTFSVLLGYLIENGELTKPVRNATLIGTNVQILNEVSMIGNDMEFFLGNCSKEGQTLPVTAGTPTMKIDKMTVGGR